MPNKVNLQYNTIFLRSLLEDINDNNLIAVPQINCTRSSKQTKDTLNSIIKNHPIAPIFMWMTYDKLGHDNETFSAFSANKDSVKKNHIAYRLILSNSEELAAIAIVFASKTMTNFEIEESSKSSFYNVWFDMEENSFTNNPTNISEVLIPALNFCDRKGHMMLVRKIEDSDLPTETIEAYVERLEIAYSNILNYVIPNTMISECDVIEAKEIATKINPGLAFYPDDINRHTLHVAEPDFIEPIDSVNEEGCPFCPCDSMETIATVDRYHKKRCPSCKSEFVLTLRYPDTTMDDEYQGYTDIYINRFPEGMQNETRRLWSETFKNYDRYDNNSVSSHIERDDRNSLFKCAHYQELTSPHPPKQPF